MAANVVNVTPSQRRASRAAQRTKAGRAKVEKTMHEFKHGGLHSGSKRGPKVTSRKQAIAIALSQARGAKK